MARIDECFLAAFEDASGQLVNNGKSFFLTNAALSPGRRALIAQWTGFCAADVYIWMVIVCYETELL